MLFGFGKLPGRASRFIGRIFRQVWDDCHLQCLRSRNYNLTLFFICANEGSLFFCYPLSKMGLFISRSRKNTIILRTALSVRVHNCIGKWNFISNILSHLPFHSLSCRSPCLSENCDLLGTHDQREGERVIYNLNSVQLKAVWSARIFLAHRQIPCQLFWKPDICCVLSHVWLIWDTLAEHFKWVVLG